MVSIALVENGIPIIGVLYNPVTAELFEASKGNGAKLNNKNIACSSKENLSSMIILNSRSETKKDFGIRILTLLKKLSLLAQLHIS